MVKCAPGEFITSLETIKKMTKELTIRNIRTALDKLAKWRFLTNESTKQGRRITILNWGLYQCADNNIDKGIDRRATNERQTTPEKATNELTPTKNIKKKDKKYKNVKNHHHDEDVFQQLLKTFSQKGHCPGITESELREAVERYGVKTITEMLPRINLYFREVLTKGYTKYCITQKWGYIMKNIAVFLSDDSLRLALTKLQNGNMVDQYRRD
jgi:hypothetical protein